METRDASAEEAERLETRDASEEEAHGKFEDQLKLSSLASPSSRLSVHSRLHARVSPLILTW